MAADAAPARPVANPAVVVLARSPRVAGKTRLTAHLPGDAAAALRCALLLDTVACALAPGWPIHLWVTPAGEEDLVRALIGADAALDPRAKQCRLHAQADGDLGARMTSAMQHAVDAGHDAVVLVGSDLPALPPHAIVDAVRALERDGGEPDVVFGPARDGGFYLVAARRAWPDLFTGIAWSRDTVLAQAQARARALGLDVTLVGTGDDVDTMTDLAALLRAHPAPAAPRTRAWAATR